MRRTGQQSRRARNIGLAAVLASLVAGGATGTATAGERGQGLVQAQVVEGPTEILFAYRLRDRAGGLHRLRFMLSKAAVAASRERFRAYDPVELKSLATRDAGSQLEAAVAVLGERYPHADFTLSDDGGVHWRIDAPPGFGVRGQQIFSERLAFEAERIRAAYAGVDIRVEPGGRVQVQAPGQEQLRQVEQQLAVARRRAQEAVARYATRQSMLSKVDARAIHADVEAALREIQGNLEGFKEAYFRERLYRLGDNGLLYPDYATIAAIEAADLHAVADAVGRWTAGLDRREALSRLLLFTQAIPYDALQQRTSETGFLPPLQVLRQNRGDCDSKSVLFAAVAHLLYPDLPLALILIPDHAYLAVGIEPEPGDAALTYDGRRWTVAEPVGPRLLALGRLSEQSLGDGAVIEGVLPLFP